MTPFVNDPGETVDHLADLLSSVANAGSVVVLVADLATTLHQDPETTWQVLGDVEVKGLVDRWPDHPDGPSVVLSALSAERLGIRPSQDGTLWVRAGQPDPTERRVRQFFETLENGFTPGYDDLIDPDSIPALDAMVAEEGRTARQRRAAKVFDQVPKKRTLAEARADHEMADWGTILDSCPTDDRVRLPAMRYFQGYTPTWPIAPTESGACGACQGRPLGHLECCLWCDRSGVDHLIPERPKPVILGPSRSKRKKSRRKAGLKGGVG